MAKNDAVSTDASAFNDIFNEVMGNTKSASPTTFTAAEQAAIDKFCTELGTDVKNANAQGNTLLHIATIRSRTIPAVIKYLISQGADVNAKEKIAGNTPLHNAAFSGNDEVATILISNGADVDAKDNHGYTPFQRAISHRLPGGNFIEKSRVAKLLASKGADVNLTIAPGRHTLLHLEAYRGNIEVVKLLVSVGADINAKDSGGSTPLDVAQREKKTAVISYLSSIGAQAQETIPTINRRRYCAEWERTKSQISTNDMVVFFMTLACGLIFAGAILGTVGAFLGGLLAIILFGFLLLGIAFMFFIEHLDRHRRMACPHCKRWNATDWWKAYGQDSYCTCKHCGFKWIMHWTDM